MTEQEKLGEEDTHHKEGKVIAFPLANGSVPKEQSAWASGTTEGAHEAGKVGLALEALAKGRQSRADRFREILSKIAGLAKPIHFVVL